MSLSGVQRSACALAQDRTRSEGDVVQMFSSDLRCWPLSRAKGATYPGKMGLRAPRIDVAKQTALNLVVDGRSEER